MNNFDVIVGNPPYNLKARNQGTVVWHKFVENWTNNFLSQTGEMLMLTPPNFRSHKYSQRSPTNSIRCGLWGDDSLGGLIHHEQCHLDFVRCGSRGIDAWHYKRGENITAFPWVHGEMRRLKYSPGNPKDQLALSIVHKFFEAISAGPQLECVYERYDSILSEKEPEDDGPWYQLFSSPKHMKKGVSSWTQEVPQRRRTPYYVLHSRSMLRPTFDHGGLPVRDGNVYYCDTPQELHNLSNFFRTELFEFVRDQFMVCNAVVVPYHIWETLPRGILYAPDVERDVFGLTEEEIRHCANWEGRGPDYKKDAQDLTRSLERITAYGEVFTPKIVVDRMLDWLNPERWENVGTRFIDPSCGNGQFLVEVIDRKLRAGATPSQSLGTTYGIDILSDNIEECRARLLERAGHCEENRAIVEKNVIVGDSLVIGTFPPYLST